MLPLQHAIYASPPNYNCPLSKSCMDGKVLTQIHVLTQAPVYIIVALAEIWGIETGYEYTFKLAPASMQSLVTAMILSITVIAALLGMIIVPFLFYRSDACVGIFGLEYYGNACRGGLLGYIWEGDAENIYREVIEAKSRL